MSFENLVPFVVFKLAGSNSRYLNIKAIKLVQAVLDLSILSTRFHL
jgi:hypothetical protein